MKYVVDAALCCAHGRCYSVAPDAFRTNDEGENSDIGQEIAVPPGLEESVRRGAVSCPDAAIKIFE